jgi:cytoskeletal protein CcmA (bactofilin family)
MGVFTKKNRNEYMPSYQAVSQTVNPTEPVVVSRLGKSLFLKGELHAQEEVLIEGQVEGSIKADGLVVIGKNGKVIADITAREIIIRGEVTGNVTGIEKVEIIPLGVLNGNIISQRVVLAEGAIFKGNIDMSVKDAPRKGLQDTKAVSPGPKVQSPESGK